MIKALKKIIHKGFTPEQAHWSIPEGPYTKLDKKEKVSETIDDKTAEESIPL
jgi:hypothetical protein